MIFLEQYHASDELIASVRYGKSTTNTGVYGRGIAHTNEFTVKAEDFAGRKFSPAELGIFSFALGHASLLHMTQKGFDKVTYNTEKSIYDGLRAELDNLGVWSDVVELEKIPHFAVSVANSPEMTRTEMGISIAVAQTALENTYPWLMQQPQQQ